MVSAADAGDGAVAVIVLLMPPVLPYSPVALILAARFSNGVNGVIRTAFRPPVRGIQATTPTERCCYRTKSYLFGDGPWRYFRQRISFLYSEFSFRIQFSPANEEI